MVGNQAPMGGHARSAVRALDVLELLARRPAPQPTPAIARECGIPKSSTHHLLNVMRSRGFVTYYEDAHAWGLGPRALEVGHRYQSGPSLQRLARPVLTRLASQTGVTAHLAILVGTDVLYLAKAEPPRARLKLVTDVGVRLPAHLTAVGLMLLAGFTDAHIRALYAEHPLERRTGRGPGDLRSLLRAVAETRARGTAVEYGSVSPGVGCMAGQIMSVDGFPAAALGVTWAAADAGQEAALQGIVRDTAGRLTRLLTGGADVHPLPGTA